MILTNGANSIDRIGPPSNLITLFYGDYKSDGNIYQFRYVNDDFIDSHRNTNNASGITETVKDNTPLGYIPVFVSGNTTSTWNIVAVFKSSIKASDFTIDFWLKYPYVWGERTQCCQLNYTSNGNDRWFIVGPFSNSGIYYNGGTGGVNVGLNLNLSSGYHHFEFDIDIGTHKMDIYVDGVFKSTVNLQQYISQISNNDDLSRVYTTNDSRNHPQTTFTQVAVWNKKMNGTCYSLGLYHDGNKFLI